ncbi:hypothetical protein BC936DRAFT_148129, partial [Jimgerdemannia flammicorona]
PPIALKRLPCPTIALKRLPCPTIALKRLPCPTIALKCLPVTCCGAEFYLTSLCCHPPFVTMNNTNNTSNTEECKHIWDNQQDSLKLIWQLQSVLSSFSILSIVAVFAYALRRIYIQKRPFHNHAERVILYTFFPIFIEMIGKSISGEPFRYNRDTSQFEITNDGLCGFQSILVEFGNMSCVIWGLSFAWDLFTIIRTFRRTSANGSWSVSNLQDNLSRREFLHLLAANVIGLGFAVAAYVYREPRDYWCWVKNDVLSTSLFFFAEEWLATIIAIGVLAYALFDVQKFPGDYRGVIDMRLGCITAFSWVLVTDIIVWLFASLSRFWSFSHCFSIELGTAQALFGSSRGCKYHLNSDLLCFFLRNNVVNILALPL